MQLSQRITPFLSYKDSAADAADFYVSVIPDSRILKRVRNPGSDSILTVEFELRGMRFIALNAGQDWKFTEAISMAIECDSQAELDAIWMGLLADGGSELACGWLKDRFGLCWQVWPSQMKTWLNSEDSAATQRMLEACWKMVKLDIAELQKAFERQG